MAGLEVLHYVGYEGDHGGIIAVIRNLASAGRFRCVLGVGPGFAYKRAPLDGTVTFARVDAESLAWRTIWRSRAIARQVRGWLAARPDRIFHGHSRAGLAAALCLERMGETRAVASVHCYGRQRWFYRWAARKLDGRLFWLSPAMKRFYGIEPGTDWTQCIPGCIPTVPLARAKPRGGSGERLRLGGVGALVPWKGWDLVLDAMAMLPEARRGRVSFCHIGKGDPSPRGLRYVGNLRRRAADPAWGGSIRWLGEQPDAGRLLADIDCLVVPSRNEPFAIAVLEALQAGVPVLAADSGGAADLIAPGEDGWLFRTGDARDLAEKISWLTEGEAWNRLRFDAAKLDRFTAPAVADQWQQTYDRVLGR